MNPAEKRSPRSCRILRAESDRDIRRCWPLVKQLRPQVKASAFVPQIRRQQAAGGYVLLFLEVNNQVQALAGYRVSECLAWGRFLYVDDLVTDTPEQGRGYGRLLMEWLLAEARQLGCDELHLDSGIQRGSAHRFYVRNGMDITCLHFAVNLRRASSGRRHAALPPKKTTRS